MKLFGKKEETALVPVDQPKEVVTEATVRKYIAAMMPGAQLSEGETTAFVEIARMMNLNPWKRELYCVPYLASQKDENGNWQKVRKLSLITGYEVYLRRAHETGRLVFWTCDIEEGDGDRVAVLQIHIKGAPEPFRWTVRMKEYAQDNKMWRDKPETMLKKTAISQGFRLAFPELQGMPYTQDEMPDNMTARVDPDPEPLTYHLSSAKEAVDDTPRLQEAMPEKPKEDTPAKSAVSEPKPDAVTFADIVKIVNMHSKKEIPVADTPKIIAMAKDANNDPGKLMEVRLFVEAEYGV